MTETIKGQVETIRLFRNSWGVMQLFSGSGNERTQVVGVLLGFEEGDTVEVTGHWETHPTYGRRFRAASIEVLIPTDASGAIAWLMSRLPQVGRRLATEMVGRYGLPGVWEVLEHEPKRLVELRGITPERAARIGEAYARHRGERDRIVAFKKYGLTDRQIARIQETLGHDALDTIRRDPYMLIEKVDGFGWARADDLARRLGLPADHPSRIRAALVHVLSEARGAGHCFVPAGTLISMAVDLLWGRAADAEERKAREADPAWQERRAKVKREANRALDDGRIVLRTGRAYEPELDEAEQDVADAVHRMLRVGHGSKAA